MSLNKRIILTAAVGLVLGASSCRKFMNVNTNPNVSQTATVQTLLPAAELYIGSAVGVDLQINGSIWAQFWTQTPVASQYITLEQFAPGQDAFATPWSNLYSAGENLYQLAVLSDTLHKKQYKAISLLLQAYTFQLLTDAWGDVPFKQALKGAFADGHMVNPKYDSQLVVYNGIIGYIDSAKKLININDAALPGTDDLIYGGDMNQWTKFANTLKLRILVRMSAINPAGAQVMIDSFYASNPVFIGTGDDAKIAYGSNSSNKSPLDAELTSTTLGSVQNLGGSSTCIDVMNSEGDPRAYIFYEGTSGSGGGVVAGITQGNYNIPALPSTYSIPNVYVAGDCSSANKDLSANAPVNLLTSWESYLLQAEVVARGWQASSSGMSDALLYDAAIQANFSYYDAALNNEWGPGALSDYTTGGGIWVTYPTAGTFATKQKFIITQKWFCMCGNQGFEAWTEWRRTGYPDFLVHPANSQIGTNFPKRFLYPTSESTANANFPATGVLPLVTKVWWDIL